MDDCTLKGLSVLVCFFCLQKTVLESIAKDDPEFTGNGYTSLAIIYAVFAICNWFVPSVITATGPRFSIIVGSFAYW